MTAMPSELKVYKVKNFLRKNESGRLSRERSTQIINEIAAAAMFNPNHNILLDFRKTEVSGASMLEILKTALELDKFKDVLTNKIANVIPDNEDRISIAAKFEAVVAMKGIDYKFFTDFEAAIEWLSDIS
jgi:hypothetical protein